MANFRQIGGGSVDGVKAIFTATANTSYASQLNELVSYYLELTQNEKIKSIIKVSSTIYRISGASDTVGGYTNTLINAGGAFSETMYLRVSNGNSTALRVRHNVGTGTNVSIVFTDLSNTNVESAIQLIVFN